MNEITNDAYIEKWNDNTEWKTEDSKNSLNYKSRDIMGSRTTKKQIQKHQETTL
jgi:hypothetical protein